MAARPSPPPALRNVQTSTLRAISEARDALRRAGRAALHALKAPVRPIENAAQTAADATHAVAETAQRAADVSKDVAREVRAELDAWSRGVARTLVYEGALALAGLFALVLLTSAAVDALDGALGEPWGAVLVGLAYVLAAAGAWLAMRKSRETAKAQRAEHASRLGEDVAHVVEPMVEALGATPPATTNARARGPAT